MDPVACWKRLVEALQAGDVAEAGDAAEDLDTWRRKGGELGDGIPAAVGCRLRDFAKVLRAVERQLEGHECNDDCRAHGRTQCRVQSEGKECLCGVCIHGLMAV